MDRKIIGRIENNTRLVSDYELAYFCIALKVEPADMLASFYETYIK